MKKKPMKLKPTKRSAKKPAKLKPLVMVVKERKKRAPSSAFTKDSPGQFQPGVSGNPSGKPRLIDAHLSRSIRVVLANRAPNDVADALKLPHGCSWSQALAQRLVVSAMRNLDLEAIKIIIAATEGSNHHLSFDGGEGPSVMRIEFVESDGDGRPCASFVEAHPTWVGGLPPKLALPPPEVPTQAQRPARGPKPSAWSSSGGGRP